MNLLACARGEAIGLSPWIAGGCKGQSYQDPPSTLNWGYIVPNSGYLGLNRG